MITEEFSASDGKNRNPTIMEEGDRLRSVLRFQKSFEVLLKRRRQNPMPAEIEAPF